MLGESRRTVRGVSADLVLVVGVAEQGQHGAPDARRGLDHVGHVALTGCRVHVLDLLAGVLGVLGQVEVAAVGDPLELRPADGIEVFDVARGC